MNIGSLIARHARYRPDRLALVYGETRLTYRQFNLRVNRLANALLARGIKKGDKLAALLGNCVELLDLYWAAAKIGAVAVPLSTLLTEKGVQGLLRDSDSVFLVAEAQFREMAERLKPELPGIRIWLSAGAEYDSFVAGASDSEPPDMGIGDSDPYNIIYSSGTTGDPKGIVHTHYVRAMYCAIFASSWRMNPESVVLQSGSIVFNGAYVTMMPAFFSGATVVLLHHFDAAEAIRAIEAEKVTHGMMVPSQVIAMMNEPGFSPARLASLRMMCVLGAPMHLEHKKRFAAALPGVYHELYGLTEGFVTILDREDFEAKMASVGAPPPFFEMRIRDEAGRDLPAGEVGEICGKGPILTPGYYKRPDLTAGAIKDGWLHSGDLGYMDEDGFLYLVDRKKDMIISGGVNVYPKDIEEIAVTHPDVAEVAVFGAPDAKWGEIPVAAVVPKRGAKLDPAALAAWINARVEAKFQRVKDVVVLDSFPRNAAGKILKRELRDKYR